MCLCVTVTFCERPTGRGIFNHSIKGNHKHDKPLLRVMCMYALLSECQDFIETFSIAINLEHDVIYELIRQSSVLEKLVSLTNMIDH